MKLARFVLGLLIATSLQVLGFHLFPWFLLIFDLFLILALTTSLDQGPVGSMLSGSAAGLVQDALTGGLFGLHGFSYTLVTWIASRVRQRVMIREYHQVGLLFALCAALNQTILVVLQFLMLPGQPLPGPGVLVLRMVTTALLGTLVFVFARRFLARMGNWRDKRNRRMALEVD